METLASAHSFFQKSNFGNRSQKDTKADTKIV